MWTRLFFAFLVAAASAQAWTPDTGYSYKVQSRTLSALHQVGDQYAGMLMRATLKLYARSSSKLYAKVTLPEYAEVHQALPGGWGSPIPEQSLDWRKLELSEKPFIIQLQNGVIQRLVVEPNMPEWELNMLKGIVSQLQVDAKAENYFNSRINDLPSDDSDNAIFKTMEDTVTGKCEVLYDISPLPEYILQSHPELVPKPEPNPEEAQTLDIVKTTNYSHCEQRPAFHHGFSGETELEPASSKMGQFFARSSVSRVVVTGRPSNHLIQSSVTTNKVILSPAVYNKQKGMVVSRMNVTLLSVNSDDSKQGWGRAEQEATHQVHDLVYNIKQQLNRQSNDEEANQSGETPQDSSEERLRGSAARRFRRSLKPRLADTRDNSESSSFEDSSISNEEWQEKTPSINERPKMPFLPYLIGNNGQSIQNNIDVVEKAVEIAQDIAKDLQNPKVVPEKATLSKFTILIRLVQTMSTRQLHKATQQLYTSEENVKAWKVLRDAVSQSGTSPALATIKELIESKKIQGEEAAEMLVQLPEKALIPNKEYVNLFFKLASSDVVKSQRHLNTTAILTFAELVRNAQVDKRTAHNRYPTHTYGRMNPTQTPAVTRDYIPYLAEQLSKAVRDGDSVLIQTYVRALGNVAHPKILAVLEPYLEGQKPVSGFQRLHMVVALNQMVKVNPSLARAVLYRIYKNISEKSDIRSAAVYLLMKTNPPASMLQRLAESTNDEHSKQVRSAVNTALEHAAALRAPESLQLAENALASKNALNNTNLGPEYSYIKLASGNVHDMNIAYRAGLATIGSEDYLAPKTAFAHFRKVLSGLKQEPTSAGYMASSTKDLINLIAAQSRKAYKLPEELMNINGETAQQTEGNIFMQSISGKRFFAFDNHTVEHIPSAIKDMLQKLSNGQSFSLQKMYNKESLTLAVPTASGLPFIYSLTTPTIVSVEGKVQAEINPEISASWKSAKASADIKILYSTKTEARIGFVTPFNSKIYLAGTDKDAQINLPIRAELQITKPAESSEIERSNLRLKLQPLKPEDIQIATLRSKPFTAQHSILDIKPAQHKVVRAQQAQKTSITIGREETGLALRVEASTDKKPLDYVEALRQLQYLDVLSAMSSVTEEKEINNYEYTITYDHDKSHNKAVLLTAAYGRLDKKPESEPYGYPDSERTREAGRYAEQEKVFDDNLAIPSNTQPDSAERLQQFLNRVTETMKISRADAIDLSAQFKGAQEAVYVATVAGARSPMKERLAALVYLQRASASGKKQEIAIFPSAAIPAAPLANYQQAINQKPTAHVEAKISFGEDLNELQSQILIKSKLERSEEREQYVREQPISQHCQQQAAHGNNFLPACQNATLAAGLMDQYAIVVKYAHIPESVKNATYKAYSLARQFGWEYSSEDLITADNAPKKLNLNVRFAPNLESVNVSIHAPQMNAQFQNVRLSQAASAALVAHPNYKPAQLVSRYVFGKDYNPTCTIDKSAISTFNNKTYRLELEEEWYVVAQYVPKKYEQTKYSPAAQIPFVKVQTRQTPNQQKEVKIFLGPKDVVEIIPRGEDLPEIKVNNHRYKAEPKTVEVQSKVDNRVFVRFHALPSGTVKLTAPQYSLDITHDKTTFVLSLGNEYRGDIRGLCGTFDGELESDFTSPQKCVMKDAQTLIKSYTVSGEGLLKHQELSVEPRACIQKKAVYGNIVTNFEAGRPETVEGEQSDRCTVFRPKVVKQDGHLCFSQRTLPTCSSHCQSEGMQEKSVSFSCLPDSAAARHWAKLAQRNGSLNIPATQNTKIMIINVPQTCNRKM